MAGGGSGVFAVLMLLLCVFGAGYFIAETSQYQANQEISEAALRQSVEAQVTLAPQATQAVSLRNENGQLKDQLAAAQAAQAKAEQERAAAVEASRLQAAEIASREAEIARLQAQLAERDQRQASYQQPQQIPATGENEKPAAWQGHAPAQPARTWLRWIFGLALFGIGTVAGTVWGRHSEGNEQRPARHAQRPGGQPGEASVYVRMTRAEAQKVARERAHHQA